ncbi:MAG: hypothetical protein N3A65_01015 [candidate division WOR-3 bacterium]|nr:hypothetical protein [candidate division WOR-3 bacterium]
MIIFFILFQSDLFEPDKILKFADYLYLQGDFNSAVNEYRRYLFLSDSNKQETGEKIIDCLVRLKRYDEADSSLKYISDTTRALYLKAWIFLLKGDYPRVREILKMKSTEHKARYYIGLSYAGEFNFSRAKEFINLPAPLPKLKSPFLGGLFSIIPGGGHFYCGRLGDGIYSLLVIAAGSTVAYYYYHNNKNAKFYLASGITILFYAGNIYGGINSVRNYNYYENARYRDLVFNQKR